VLGNSNSELELTPELTLFFSRVGVELKWNFIIIGWSWSGAAVAWSGVGAELEWNLIVSGRSWSGVVVAWSGVGVELELSVFYNSDLTPIDFMTCQKRKEKIR
jgi:hypothetical protein